MLNKEKYNLRQMDISTKTKDGKILFYELKIRGKTFINKYIHVECLHVMQWKE